MAVREVLVLSTILAGASAWLSEYACENVVRFGSRADVEQCFQDRLPEQIARLFLRCAQDSHASRAYTVLQDYCQDDRFRNEIYSCMSQDEGSTLVTQSVAFRTLRACLERIARSTPDDSSESNEDSGRALRKRDLSENEVDVDEKAPKEGEIAEETSNNSEELSKVEYIIVTETIAVPTDAPPVFVTEIVSLAEAFTEATLADETNEIDKNEETDENNGLDIEPIEVVDETANDIPPAEIENTPSQADVEGDKVTEEEAGEAENDDDDQIVDLGNDEENSPSEESDKDNDQEDNPSEESDKDDDQEDKPSGESDTDDDNNTGNDESNSSTNGDSAEYDFSFPELDYPFGFLESDEIDDVDGSRETINERYNRINFVIYLNKK